LKKNLRLFPFPVSRYHFESFREVRIFEILEREQTLGDISVYEICEK